MNDEQNLDIIGADLPQEPLDCAAGTGKRIGRKIVIGAIGVILIAVAAIGFIRPPFLQYQYAVFQMNQGHYEEAEQRFKELGEYRDADSLWKEARKGRLYQTAQEYMDQQRYDEAWGLYRGLGPFLDSIERGAEAEHLAELQIDDRYADEAIESGEYIWAYSHISRPVAESYPGAEEKKERILDFLYNQVETYLADDETLKARAAIQILEDEGYGGLEEIWDSAVREKRLELDDSFFSGFTDRHITSVSRSTTAQDYASVIKYLYLGGGPKITLRKSGTGQNYNVQDQRLLKGVDLMDCLMAEHASVYNFEWNYEYDGSGNVLWVEVRACPGAAETIDEAAEHIRGIRAFCEERVRELNDELLITNSMSSREKAWVILNWVCNYLDFDKSEEIHDTYCAIESETGVCESYVALYNVMCNLAGIKTYGQIGKTNDQDETETHIWSIQEDENGDIFYTDATWADTAWTGKGMSVPELAASMENTCRTVFWDSNFQSADEKYFWQETVWDSHTPVIELEEIKEVYDLNT